MDLDTLLADRDIRHGLARFAEVVDARAWERLGEVFAPDAVTVYGEFRSEGHVAIEAHFRRFLGRCGPSQHLLGNIEVTVDGATARSRASVLASHRGADPQDAREFVAYGGYDTVWRRDPSGWRVTAWTWRQGWFRGDIAVLGAR
jgi:ketosteroid isomerase-like protein